MVASPTLNVIVLTMLFSILPFYMAVAKIALSLFVILLAVPILCRFLPARELQVAEADRVRCKPARSGSAAGARRARAGRAALRDRLREKSLVHRLDTRCR